MTKYIRIDEAASYLNVSQQAVYRQIRRNVIKATRIEGQIYTTLEWLKDYESKKHNKSWHARFNGRPVFSEEKGELSVEMCAKRLNVGRMFVLNKILNGQLPAMRRGHYYVIRQAQLEELILSLEEQKQSSNTG